MLYVGGWRGGDEKLYKRWREGREGTKSFTRSGGVDGKGTKNFTRGGGKRGGDKKLYKRWREARSRGGLGNRILMACYWNIHQLALGFVWHLHIVGQ